MLRRILLCFFAFTMAASGDEITGDVTIRAPVGESEIVITTTERLAGAIHSLTWNGIEFINSNDHGRQLQSASNFDAGSRFSGETFNPTEAGSRRDGAGPTIDQPIVAAWSRPRPHFRRPRKWRYWLAPGETSGGQPAKEHLACSPTICSPSVSRSDIATCRT